ncbi:Zn-dependent protease [Pseudarthrobacter oxydans]|uniref:site-2 protease family protein n=1 Tax=Pseudarthrobacter oxydans TaxID=1671 RepID=UPI002785D6DC|nr:site-2 protease family protein [Pseudarthrobacter oxydans]MDP9984132.1 Zn-dependent protease [Pseudarthrobacter oxydans]
MTDTDTRGRSGQDPQKQGRKEGIPLGRIAGIPVILAYSWFIIAAFTVIAFGPVLQSDYPRLGVTAFFVAFAYALLLLISVLVHELAHALTAKLFHWPTEKIVLNLWGGHTEFQSFTASPGRSVLVAMAGPAANFVLAGAGWLLRTGGDLTGVPGILTNIFVWANLLIGIFNVLPGLPLDGGRLVESAVWKLTGSQEKGTVAAGWGGRIIVIGLVAWFVVLPLLSGDRPDISLMLITVLVGSFLWMGATASIEQARLRSRLPLVEAGALAEPAVGLPEGASVAEVLALAPDPTTGAGPAVVLYRQDGRPAAVVDAGAVATVSASAAATTPLTAVSYALGEGAYVPEWSKGQELIQYLAQLDGLEYAVVDRDGTVTGLLRQSAVLGALTGKNPGSGKRMFGQSR